MRKFAVVSVIAIVALACVVVFAQEEAKTEKQIDPKAELKASIERGKMLFMDPKLGTNEQTCTTCHMQGGTVAGKVGDTEIRAFDSLGTKYPMYWPMANKVITLDQVVNFCIVHPLKGKPLPCDDQRMADLVAYCASVKPMKPEEKKEMKTEGEGK
jgi:cytochrome c